ADGDNLYYAGLRVDGHAVIKKKAGGAYVTLAEAPVFEGAYDRAANPNLLPAGRWMGIRAETRGGADGKVLLSLYADTDASGRWQLVAQAVDDGTAGGPPHRDPGLPGVRTDFMDVTFDDYLLEPLPPAGSGPDDV